MDETLDEVLEHFGIKGMKWGVRKSRKQRQEEAASADSKVATKHLKTAKTSGMSSLSNAELQVLVKRLQLEQQYSNLTAEKKDSIFKKMQNGNNAVKTTINTANTMSALYKMSQTDLGRAVFNEAKKKSRKGGAKSYRVYAQKAIGS